MISMSKFVDSDVIIFASTSNPKQDLCFKFIKTENITINSLVLVECLSKIATITKNKDFAVRTIKAIYNSGNIEIVDLNKNLFFEAMKRFGRYDLKISDLIHYTTALLSGCSSIVSYDTDFDNLEIKREVP